MVNQEQYIADFKSVISSYHPLSTRAFNALLSISTFQEIPKNSILLQQGQIAKHLYFICLGTLIAYCMDEKAKRYTKNIFFAQDFAASTSSALLKKPSLFTLQSIEDSILLSLNYQDYKELIHQDAELRSFYIAYLEQNWVIAKEKREISLVMEDAGLRYQQLMLAQPGIEKRIPLQHIASHLGISATQLSRIRKKLK